SAILSFGDTPIELGLKSGESVTAPEEDSVAANKPHIIFGNVNGNLINLSPKYSKTCLHFSKYFSLLVKLNKRNRLSTATELALGSAPSWSGKSERDKIVVVRPSIGVQSGGDYVGVIVDESQHLTNRSTKKTVRRRLEDGNEKKILDEHLITFTKSTFPLDLILHRLIIARMKSLIYEYFYSGQDKETATCKFCQKKTISKFGSTTAIWTHLMKIHSMEYINEMEPKRRDGEQEQKGTTLVEQYFIIPPASTGLWLRSEPECKEGLCTKIVRKLLKYCKKSTKYTRLRKFRSVAESPPHCVERIFVIIMAQKGALRSRIDDVRWIGYQRDLSTNEQHCSEPGSTELILRRKIRSSNERLQIGSKPNAHRPTVTAVCSLIGKHMDLKISPISSLSNDSCSITWHQWQVEYPIDKKINFCSRAALSNASLHHGYL
uniref:BED-type domain-containing protein n=1 Tax=Romanomermis culicivorax TaxID=13658 RepID=A0A915KET7_ROMCU